MDNVSPNFRSSDALATAPPPPAEVKIRTMRSDLESMAKSGGGLPRFQDVKVGSLSENSPRPTAPIESSASIPASTPTPAPASAQKPTAGNFFTIIVGVVVLAAIAFGGWFVYVKFLNTKSAPPSSQSATPPTPSSTTQSNSATVPVVTPTVPFAHASFFKTPADQVLSTTFSSPGAAQSAADLQTYNQKMLALLATAKKSATFLEIDAKDSAGNDASINELFAAASAPVIAPTTVAADFNPDATFFIYRDATGFWPGYVISLASGTNWSAVQNDAKTIESSPSIGNLFLTDIGSGSTDGFTDSVIASSSVRVLPFLGGTVPGYFTYGWTPDDHYLILSTSQAGFAQALAQLDE